MVRVGYATQDIISTRDIRTGIGFILGIIGCLAAVLVRIVCAYGKCENRC